MKKKLYRSENKMLCGVLAGIGEYFDIDPTLIRVLFVVLTLFTASFPGIILYIIFAIVIPVKPDDFNNNNTWNDPNNYNNYNQNQQ